MKKKINKNFWKNKKVLITGINGFVGSNLAKELLKNGAEVVGLIRNKNRKTLLFAEKINKKINLIDGDVENKKILKRIFTEQNIDICFHLAAQVEVGLAQSYPYLTWETNIKGTYTFLEAIRENGKKVKSIIVASSDKAYGEYPSNKMPYRENYELRPKYPYDVSKACSDLIAKSYSEELFNLPIAITRFSNIYGPGQANFSALIPDCIKSIIKKSRFILRGNGEHKRDFLYVKDVINLYMQISKSLYLNPKKIRGEVFNAGSNRGYKVKDIIKSIYKMRNKEKNLRSILKKARFKKTKGEIQNQYMNYKKVNKFFGWRPSYNIEKGLKETFDWYKKYINKIV